MTDTEINQQANDNIRQEYPEEMVHLLAQHGSTLAHMFAVVEQHGKDNAPCTWIDVDGVLPDDDTEVEVFTAHEHHFIAFHSDTKFQHGDIEITDVTHWRHLTPPQTCT